MCKCFTRTILLRMRVPRPGTTRVPCAQECHTRECHTRDFPAHDCRTTCAHGACTRDARSSSTRMYRPHEEGLRACTAPCPLDLCALTSLCKLSGYYHTFLKEVNPYCYLETHEEMSIQHSKNILEWGLCSHTFDKDGLPSATPASYSGCLTPCYNSRDMVSRRQI